MQHPILLSIITVNFNNAEGLKKTINSVIPHLNETIEYLILDGGSTDESQVQIENVQQHLAYWTSEKDSGIYAAMNKGIRSAKGEYVLFLNSGDFLLEGQSLNSALSLLAEGHDLLSCGIQVETEKKGHVLRRPIKNYSKIEILLNCLPHQSTFIKRHLFLEYGLYDESFKIAADMEFWLRIVDKPIRYVSSDLILSRMEKEGLGASRTATHFKERLRIFNKYSRELKLNTAYLKLLYRNRQLILWHLLTKKDKYS